MSMQNQNIKGAFDLYEQMAQIAEGTRGCVVFSKARAKELGIKWSFVEGSAEILGLTINKAGMHGFNISK